MRSEPEAVAAALREVAEMIETLELEVLGVQWSILGRCLVNVRRLPVGMSVRKERHTADYDALKCRIGNIELAELVERPVIECSEAVA